MATWKVRYAPSDESLYGLRARALLEQIADHLPLTQHIRGRVELPALSALHDDELEELAGRDHAVRDLGIVVPLHADR